MRLLIPDIHEAVSEFLKKNPDIDVSQPAGIETVIAETTKVLASKLPDPLGREDPIQLRLIVAMCALGPQETPPPEDLYRQLRDKLLLYDVTNPYNDADKMTLLEIVVAFGAGKWRNPVGESGWYARWGGAVRFIVRYFESGVRYFSNRIGRIYNLKKVDISSIANLLALIFCAPERSPIAIKRNEHLCIQGNGDVLELRIPTRQGWCLEIPPGAKYVMTLKGDGITLKWPNNPGNGVSVPSGSKVVVDCHNSHYDVRISVLHKFKKNESATIQATDSALKVFPWECGCGTDCCRARHHLRSWDPDTFDLRRFIFVATMGLSRGSAFSPGSFAQSMLYAHLCNPGFEVQDVRGKRLQVRLRFGPAIIRRCTCGSPFAGDQCSRCIEKFDPKKMRQIKKDCLILEGDGQWFFRKSFARCKNCDNLIEITDADLIQEAICPHCQGLVITEKKLRALIDKYNSNLARRRAVHKAKAHKRPQSCDNCGELVETSNWACPYCGASDFGQREVYVWSFSPEFLSHRRIDDFKAHSSCIEELMIEKMDENDTAESDSSEKKKCHNEKTGLILNNENIILKESKRKNSEDTTNN